MRRAIVHADDFGLSASVNEAVLAAAEGGVLTSATIMATMPAFEEAVRGAKRLSKLGVGVHLDLLRGRSLTSCGSLTRPDGRFLNSLPAFAARFLSRAFRMEELKNEVRAQVLAVKGAGLLPTHVDSEKHLHLLFPKLFGVVCRVAREEGIRAVRIVNEDVRAGRMRFLPWLKSRLLNRHTRVFRSVAEEFGLRFIDHSWGIAYAGDMTARRFVEGIPRLPDGVTEIMTHPAVDAHATAVTGRVSYLDASRVDEYHALVDPRVMDAFMKASVARVHYGDLA